MQENQEIIMPESNTGMVDHQQNYRNTIAMRGMVEQCMKTILEEKKHYDVIPGCGTKPALLKAGAEILCSVFGLSPEFEIKISELGGGHREYNVTCNLLSFDKQKFFGSGIGSCSTMEKKYRWRGGFESTGEVVPKEYWKHWKTNIAEAKKILGGEGFIAKKMDVDGKDEWMICVKGDAVENPDIADVYNTVLKMAKKRALVDAVLTRTAASDIFTQDIEELRKDYDEKDPIPKTPPPVRENLTTEPEPVEPKPPIDKKAAAAKKIFDLLKQNIVELEAVAGHVYADEDIVSSIDSYLETKNRTYTNVTAIANDVQGFIKEFASQA